jgi:hypothetical protein
MPWFVWLLAGGGAAVLAIVFLVGLFALARYKSESSTPSTAGTVPTLLKTAEELAEETRLVREQHELMGRQIQWKGQLSVVLGHRKLDLMGLTVPLSLALDGAVQDASKDQERRAVLTRERDDFAADSLQVPRSPEARTEATRYTAKRLEGERRTVRELLELKATMPEGIAAANQDKLAQGLAAGQEAIRRLESAQTELAALPAPWPKPVPGAIALAPVLAPIKPAEERPPQPVLTQVPPDAAGAEKKKTEPRARPPRGWGLEADPPREKLSFEEPLPYRELSAKHGDKVVYPPGQTAFVAVGIGEGNIEAFAIGDLRTGKPVGAARGLNLRPYPLADGGPALSPDGTYLAFFDSIRKAVLVVNVKRRKAPLVLDFDDIRIALFFPKPDQLLALPTSGKSPAMLWKIPSGELLQSFPVVPNWAQEAGRTACSPGGRYLAVAAEGGLPKTVHFYDLTTGKQVATLEGPNATRDHKPYFNALAFSVDGTEFAAFLGGVRVGLNSGQAMASWEMKTGELVYHRVLDRGNRGAVIVNGPEPLQWFPDGKGWLLNQQHVVDREAAAFVETIEGGSNAFDYFGNKVLDNRRVLKSASTGQLQVVSVKRIAK